MKLTPTASMRQQHVAGQGYLLRRSTPGWPVALLSWTAFITGKDENERAGILQAHQSGW